jgi:hypothetical protein
MSESAQSAGIRDLTDRLEAGLSRDDVVELLAKLDSLLQKPDGQNDRPNVAG